MTIKTAKKRILNRQAKRLWFCLSMITLSLFLLVVILPAEQEQDWQLSQQSEGITTYTRFVANSPLKESRGEGFVDAPIEEVYQAMMDIESYPQYSEMVEQAKILEKKSDSWLVVYTLIDLPWPVADREAITEYRVTRQANGIIFSSKALADHPRAPKRDTAVVRITQLNETVILVPKKNQTLVKYQSHANPGGDIPQTVANWLVGYAPIDAIQSTRKMVQMRRIGK